MVNQGVTVKVASASLNQTVYDFATNVPHVLQAIDRAVADGATVLSLPELSLTGYAADDYHQWHQSNDAVWPYVQIIAAYAYEKNPNLILTLGTPWHYADKSRPADDVEYNRTNRPFNTQMMITQGRVVAIAAKSILADGPAEYESRQFRDWPISKGTIDIALPDGSSVPFGKPVVAFVGQDGRRMTVTLEVCAEGWPGVNDDGTINEREQAEARHIVKLAQNSDLSVIMNPSASKPQPAINKEAIRMKGLCETGSRYGGVYVYTNVLGSDSGTYAAEGSQIFAQDGKIIHHGPRYSFEDVSYSSVTVALPPVKRCMPDAALPYEFADHAPGQTTGPEAGFDQAFGRDELNLDELKYEEYMRTVALWHRDYLSKPNRGTQGAVISLSGGKDSAYGALAVTTMIDLEVRENGIDGFFQRFQGLAYEADVRAIQQTQGDDAALDAIKKNFLTCVYIPTDISSKRTLNAARFLVEGGTLPDGTVVKGIGGTFYVAPVQAVLDETIIAFTGLDLDAVARAHADEILGPNADNRPEAERLILARGQLKALIKDYVTTDEMADLPVLPDYITKNCIVPIPTWANPSDDLTLQNLQARVRLPIPWAVANKENKVPLVTSNESEVVLGYSTAGGDMHMGGANGIGGVPKHEITASLRYLEEKGLFGFGPVHALHWILRELASAELRKEKEGAPQQTDENDLGFTYEQSNFMEEHLLTNRQLPVQVLANMQKSLLFPDNPIENRDILVGFCKKWGTAHFKRIMAVLAPHTGRNVEPHQSVRTTVLGDHFRTACAHMTLDVISGLLDGAKGPGFEETFGVTMAVAKTTAGINAPFRAALYNWPVERLLKAENWGAFGEAFEFVRRYSGAACDKPA